MFDDRAGYNERIERKDIHEAPLWEAIQEALPWVIERGTAEEDMGGIDGWYDHLKGGATVTRKTIQLKMRQSGDDILLEVIKPWRGLIEYSGRDVVGAAVDIYFCVNSRRVLRVYTAGVLMGVVNRLIEGFRGKGERYYGEEGEVRVVTDPSHESNYKHGKVKKVVVFVNPLKVKCMYEVQLKVEG